MTQYLPSKRQVGSFILEVIVKVPAVLIGLILAILTGIAVGFSILINRRVTGERVFGLARRLVLWDNQITFRDVFTMMTSATILVLIGILVLTHLNVPQQVAPPVDATVTGQTAVESGISTLAIGGDVKTLPAGDGQTVLPEATPNYTFVTEPAGTVTMVSPAVDAQTVPQGASFSVEREAVRIACNILQGANVIHGEPWGRIGSLGYLDGRGPQLRINPQGQCEFVQIVSGMWTAIGATEFHYSVGGPYAQ
ncbi:hypothetical protein GC177_01965 [bacterium]|nr:hypothetical protein [bacterium]